MGSGSLITLMLAAIAFSAGGIAVSKFLTKGSTNLQKGQAYECGVPAAGSPWKQFNVGYYLFALIFLVFEVELVFMFPWAVTLKQIGVFGFVSMMIFLAVLTLGFIYEWKKGALEW